MINQKRRASQRKPTTRPQPQNQRGNDTYLVTRQGNKIPMRQRQSSISLERDGAAACRGFISVWLLLYKLKERFRSLGMVAMGIEFSAERPDEPGPSVENVPRSQRINSLTHEILSEKGRYDAAM